MFEFDDFFDGYLTAALWSSTDTLPGTRDEHGDGETVELDQYEWGEGVTDGLKEEALDFFTKHQGLLIRYIDMRRKTHPAIGWDDAGHDFWLTRNGHGVGFWDRGCGALGDELTALVGHDTEYPPVDLYLGDDLLVYV